jgi:hypothetical protein
MTTKPKQQPWEAKMAEWQLRHEDEQRQLFQAMVEQAKKEGTNATRRRAAKT